ncbi:hypothetical protein GCM10011363_43360 [Marivita lacus]|uniref:DUF305 domain-containing protein n=1 Tax=Marivita lacus TaxID=1323742 RepID=A0ABQ1LDZ9_9RHOB|nr:DUF305 domain-containing protein [Marivita lacus]GGC22098.1 hypothetical protein GCM10011363_43360 [Marivita lacus]
MVTGVKHEDTYVACVFGMIPHEMGVISMAHTQIAAGSDTKNMEWARHIIFEHTQEIHAMLAWLEAREIDVPDSCPALPNTASHCGPGLNA